MYIVFARKYRPQSLDEVIGQDIVVKTIKNAIEQKRLYHSILFYGSMGTGKTSLARIIAKSLNCENGPTVNPCGKCEHCIAIQEGRSVDVIEIDGASNRRIDDARNIIESTRYAPLSARFKIFIIDEVHMLTEEAFNALLKTIEEPPEYVKFIFATTNIEKVPQTILSRCQIFKLNKITADNIYVKLKKILESENIQADDDGVKLISKISAGSLRVAENYLDRVVAYKSNNISAQDVSYVLGVADYSIIDNFIDAIVNFDSTLAFETIEYLNTHNLKVETFIEMLIERLLCLELSVELKTAFLKFFYDAYIQVKHKIDDIVALKVATQKSLALKNLTKIEEILENSKDKQFSINDFKDVSNKNINNNNNDNKDIDTIENMVIDLFGGEIITKG